MTPQEIETELKKRLKYPYRWGRKQTNFYNGKTNFIYKISDFDELLKEINRRFKGSVNYKDFFNYTLNRWYNFWSAKAVEKIFCSMPNVNPFFDKKNKLVDFEIQGVSFDHKTSVFPKNYPKDLVYAQKNPTDLIKWLYENQSQQQRKHLKNRLFIILYSNSGTHWQLKAEVQWLKDLIKDYVKSFNPKNLYKFNFEPNSITLSDIIWAIK
ncbi:MAG: hypothetical protein ACKKMV_03015 [Candidatus Nealsonbacteria bacterium]